MARNLAFPADGLAFSGQPLKEEIESARDSNDLVYPNSDETLDADNEDEVNPSHPGSIISPDKWMKRT